MVDGLLLSRSNSCSMKEGHPKKSSELSRGVVFRSNLEREDLPVGVAGPLQFPVVPKAQLLLYQVAKNMNSAAVDDVSDVTWTTSLGWRARRTTARTPSWVRPKCLASSTLNLIS